MNINLFSPWYNWKNCWVGIKQQSLTQSLIWNSDVIAVSQLKQVIHFWFTIHEITYIHVSCGVDYTKESEDRGQKSYKLLKERFPMKYAYTIISTAFILKTTFFICKAKVSGHVFVWRVSILPLIGVTVFFFSSYYWHCWHFSNVHLWSLWCLK